MDAPATERYEVAVRPASLLRRIFGPVIVLVVNLVTSGGGPANPGGRTFVVRDRHSGEVVSERPEQFGDDQAGLAEAMRRDLESMTVDEFRAEWLTGGHHTQAS